MIEAYRVVQKIRKPPDCLGQISVARLSFLFVMLVKKTQLFLLIFASRSRFICESLAFALSLQPLNFSRGSLSRARGLRGGALHRR